MNIAKLSLSFIFFLLTAAIIAAQPGSLDPTFGNGGTVVGGSLSNTENNFAVQADGKIVVAATINSKFGVVRYNADGALDTSFGVSGSVVTDFYANRSSGATTVVVQPDGKIVAAGTTLALNGSLVNQTEITVARFLPNGLPDASFGDGGKVITGFGAFDKAKDIVLQPDGKILLTGDALYRFGSFQYKGVELFAVRYTTGGALDSAFGNGGIARASFEMVSNPPITGSHTSESLALQPDGKIVVVGTASVVAPSAGFVGGAAVARFLPNGQLDNSFDTDGKAFTVIYDNQNTQNDYQIKAVALQSDGRIVVAGSIGGFNNAFPYDFAVFRYTTTGMLDNSFDGDGRLISSIEAGNDYARDVSVQPNGKIIVVGESAVGTNKNFALARYNPDGSFDNSFDGDGRAITDFGSGLADSISGVALLTDGKILVAGVSGNNVALARYIGDTPVARRTQFDFDGDGRADIAVFRPSNGTWYRLNSQNNSFAAAQFGISTDKLATADYDGDGKTDIAVFREGASGYFYILNSSNNTFRFEQFGTTGDAPVPGDWDNDAKADLAVYRGGIAGAQSNFFYRPTGTPGVDFRVINWGTSGDKPVASDYDGDGKFDAAVFRPSNGVWYVLRSIDNQLQFAQFGIASDIPTAADYDGDGKTDYAIFRPSTGTWFTSQNPATNYGAIRFGQAGDVPVAADYDGDGRADAAVFRNGAWYLLRTQAGFTGVAFGAGEDKPIPNAFVP